MRAAALVTLCCALGACGAPPSEATIYYDPALRPGVVEADSVEQGLLSRLDELPAGEPVQLGDRVYVAEAAYAAASGRRCRAITIRAGADEQARLACEADGGWVFVPDVRAEVMP